MFEREQEGQFHGAADADGEMMEAADPVAAVALAVKELLLLLLLLILLHGPKNTHYYYTTCYITILLLLINTTTARAWVDLVR